MSSEAVASQWSLHLLVNAAFERGYHMTAEVLLIVLGLIPAALLEITRAPGYESAPLILAAFWAVPTVLLAAWTPFDREGQAGREINMWFESAIRTAPRSGTDHPVVVAFETAAEGWNRRSFAETASALRAALAPIAQGRLPIRFWVFEARFFFPLLWLFVSIIVLVTFIAAVALSPECAGQIDATATCH